VEHPLLIHGARIDQAMAAAEACRPGNRPILFLRHRDDVPPFLERLRNLNALAIDFDGTLTRGNTFRQVEILLSPELKERGQAALAAHEDFAWGRAATAAERTPPRTFRAWLEGNGAGDDAERVASECGLLMNSALAWASSQVMRHDLRTLVHGMPPRDGARDLCRLFAHPTVVSAGVENVIRFFLEQYAFTDDMDVIAGMELAFGDDGSIAGVHHNLWPSSFKGRLVERLRQFHGLQREQMLCIGDTPFDLPLLRAGGFSVTLCAPKTEDPPAFRQRQRGFADLWTASDALLVGNTLQPLVDLVRHARTL